MNFLRRPAVSASAGLRGNPLRRNGDLAMRRRRESDAGDPVVPRGHGAHGRHQPEHKRLCEPGHRRPLLLQGPRARLSRIDGLRQHLYSRPAEYSVAKDPICARRRSGQGALTAIFFRPTDGVCPSSVSD